MNTNSVEQMREAMEGLLSIIDAAGLINLSSGVQLGQTVWYVKASDAVDYARATLAALASAQPEQQDKELQLARLEAFAGQAGQAHLAQRLDEAVELAAEAIELMTRFHGHAEPDDTPDMNAVFPALHFKNFVDDHARLMCKLHKFKRNPVDPAFLRLKKAADEVCAVLGHHGTINARDDRVQTLMDCLYATDQITSVYADATPSPQQEGMQDEFPPLPETKGPYIDIGYTGVQMREYVIADRLSRSKEAQPEAANACETCGGEGWVRDEHDMEQGLIRCQKCPRKTDRAPTNGAAVQPEAAQPAPMPVEILQRAIEDEKREWTGDHRLTAHRALDDMFERFKTLAAFPLSVQQVPAWGIEPGDLHAPFDAAARAENLRRRFPAQSAPSTAVPEDHDVFARVKAVIVRLGDAKRGTHTLDGQLRNLLTDAGMLLAELCDAVPSGDAKDAEDKPQLSMSMFASAKEYKAAALQVADQQDAARYRWWRSYFESGATDMPRYVCEALTPEQLDESIDAAMQQPNATTDGGNHG